MNIRVPLRNAASLTLVEVDQLVLRHTGQASRALVFTGTCELAVKAALLRRQWPVGASAGPIGRVGVVAQDRVGAGDAVCVGAGIREQVKRCVMRASFGVEKLSFGNAHVHFQL